MRNNGNVFEEEDWKRLSSIASGNPNEEAIGFFGMFIREGGWGEGGEKENIIKQVQALDFIRYSRSLIHPSCRLVALQ